LETWLSNMDLALWQKFALAALIGLMVGLEREHSYQQSETTHFAGIRTFPLMTLLGCTAAFLSTEGQPWLFAVGFAGLAVLVLIVYAFSAQQGDLGVTTEIVVLLVYLIGGLIYWDQIWLAVALGVTVTVLLAARPALHGLVARIEREDIYAALKFAVVSAVVLPLLPNEAYGPWEVLNPFRIWLMVVFVSAVGFTGYVAIKLLGPQRGIGITGLLGGLVSSTAVTLNFAQRSRDATSLGKHLAFGIVIASVTMYPTVLVQALVFNRRLAGEIWLPLLILSALGAALCVFLWQSAQSQEGQETKLNNPFRLWPAIQFGLLFGAVLVITRGAQAFLGDTGVYVTSFLAGLTGLDAVTLSMAQLAGNGVSYGVATQALLLAVTANTLAKAALTLFLGAPSLRRYALPSLGFLALISLGLAIWT
jgi:uncharacterized membrane protein (DUF4010 family)